MQKNSDADSKGRFDFGRDTFAFRNETYWEYHFDPATGKTTFSKREPQPDYAHRCFVLTRAARQFFYHARFDPNSANAGETANRHFIQKIVARNPRKRCMPDQQIVIPGYANLREFSAAQAPLLKAGCGGAWRSYVLRSHWRMVFPISREHQAKTAVSLQAKLRANIPPIVHLVKFPALTINHGMLVFEMRETGEGIDFVAADPNNTEKPTTLSFDRKTGTFSLPANHYWAGGPLDIIEIYCSWVM